MSVANATRMNARQYEHLGADPPGVRLELVNGEVAVGPSPLPCHSVVSVNLNWLLRSHIQELDLGVLLTDVDTVFGEYDVRRPDLLFISKARAANIDFDQPLSLVPDLCIEILSPTSHQFDRIDKRGLYARAGVRFYWILDPKMTTIEAYELREGSYHLVGGGRGNEIVCLPPFPRLSLRLEQVWRP